MKVSYVSLEKNVLLDRLGGYSHILGVIEGLSKGFDVSLWSYAVGSVNVDSERVISKEIPSKSYYWEIVKEFISDRNSIGFVFRKTLLGMYCVAVAIIFKRMRGDKQKYFMEFNGISGDYRLGWGKQVFLLINVLPLFVFDGIYCVNEGIRQRLIGTRLVSKDKVFTCLNGGGKIIAQYEDVERHRVSGDAVNLFYYGADRDFYHLDELVGVIGEFNSNGKNEVKIVLHLIGPGMNRFDAENVVSYGERDIYQFGDIVDQVEGMAWGVIPLNRLKGGEDIEPIKTFDYMRLGLPILHSQYCLRGFDVDLTKTICYEKSAVGVSRALSRLSMLDKTSYLDYVKAVLKSYPRYTWEERLLILFNRLKTD